MFNGDNDCRCSDDASDVLESLVARRCTTSSGQNGILLSAAGPCEPVTFGSGCASHDTTGQAVTSLCEKTFDNSCNRSWCYVENKDSCMSSPSHRVYRSKYFATANDGVDLFYAYTVCNSSDDLPSVPNPKQTLGGVTILTTVSLSCQLVLDISVSTANTSFPSDTSSIFPSISLQTERRGGDIIITGGRILECEYTIRGSYD